MPPEATQFMFNHKQLVTALVKEAGLHEGIWMLAINMGFGMANMAPNGKDEDAMPTAMLPIMKVGIQRGNELNALSVDAAVVNPK